jgi:hypothetical protein
MRSAEMVFVVLAKIHSVGFFGGEAISLITDSGMSRMGYFGRKRLSSAIVETLCEGVRISGSVAPICGVNRLNQTFAISGRQLQKLRNSSR